MKAILAVVFVFLVGTVSTLSTQAAGLSDVGVNWTKFSGNPLSLGPDLLMDPWVVYDGQVYKMWYASGATSSTMQIYFADSSDGVNWHLHGVVLGKGNPGSWEDAEVYNSVVLFDGTVYRMWYLGRPTTPTTVFNMIGYATSPDGVVWTKYAANPVLTPGGNGGWDDWAFGAGMSMIFNGTHYIMWYSAQSSFASNTQIGAATSIDGISWTKYSNNPVLTWGPDWDSDHIYAGPLVKNGTRYAMWYTGQTRDLPSRIGLATSPDGFSWIKYAQNPVLDVGITGSWDSIYIHCSSVIRKGNDLLMFYYASDGQVTRIGLAVSYGSKAPAVGGEWVPINKLELLTPWIGLASLALAFAVLFIYTKRKNKQQY